MCQLTLLSSNHIPSEYQHVYNAIFGSILIFNGLDMKDGWGVFTQENGLYKSSKCILDDPSMFNVLKGLSSKNLFGHIRLSTTAKNNISDENSHPFDFSNIVIAHNGTLEPKKGNIPYDMTDSEFFGKVFSEQYEKEKNIVTALKNSYVKFDGKFAFIIYDKYSGKYYIAKGVVAPLHTTVVNIMDNKKNIKFSFRVINTQRKTVEHIQYLLSSILPFFDLYAEIEDIKVIVDNSIVEVNGTKLSKVGDIVETFPPKVHVSNGVNFVGGAVVQTNKIKNIEQLMKLGAQIYKAGLSLEEFGYIITTISASENLFDFDYSTDLDDLIAALLKETDDEKLLVWYEIINKMNSKNYFDIFDIYLATDLKFPYMLNTTEDLRDISTNLIPFIEDYKEMEEEDE